MNIQHISGRLLTAVALVAGAMLGTGCQDTTQNVDSTPVQQSMPAQRGIYRPNAGAGFNVSQLAFPTGDPATSAVLLSTVTPVEARVNQPYNYQLHVTNLSSAPLQNVNLSSTNQSNLDVTASKPEAQKVANGYNWQLGNIPAGETRVVEVTGRATAVGDSVNCLAVSYNNLLCTAVRITQPALAVTKTAPAEVMICDPINFVFDVKNTGTGTASNVVLTDQLPSGLMTLDGQQTVTAPVGDLAPGAGKRVNVAVKAARTGSYNNTGSVAAGGNLTAQSNQTTTVVRQPVLALACQAPEKIFIGRNATFAFTVRNTGDGVSRNTTLSVPLPGGTQFVSATEGGAGQGTNAVWNLGDVAPGANRTVSVTVKPSGIATFNTNATVQGVCAAPVSTQCATTVEGIPAVLLEVVDLIDPVEVGGQTTYVIQATNQGSTPLTNIRMIGVLTAEQDFVSAAGASAGTSSGKNLTFAPLPTLAPGAKAEWRIVIKANAPADTRFRVNMVSDQFSKPVEELESTNQYR